MLSCYVGNRSWREPLAITASVEWHLGASDEPVNTFLAKNEPKTKIAPLLPDQRITPNPFKQDILMDILIMRGLHSRAECAACHQ